MLVTIVTIKNAEILYKQDIAADKIEWLNFVENDFGVVSQKNRFTEGEKGVYILPDTCIPDNELFADFHAPGGDPKKCILGSHGRVRAKKFSFHKGDGEAVYSNGILLKISEVETFTKKKVNESTLEKDLGLFKYEEPERTDKHGIATGAGKEFPIGFYKTDETNFKACGKYLHYPVQLAGTLKVDGSSITIGIKNGEPIVCSRNVMKPFTHMKTVGHICHTFEMLRKNFTFTSLKEYVTYNIALLFNWHMDTRIRIEVPNDDEFLLMAMPYVKAMQKLGANNLVLRGELNGAGFKGSGNPKNPASKEKANIKFFGSDSFDKSWHTVKDSYEDFMATIAELNTNQSDVVFETVPEIFNRTFESQEELIAVCNEYFKNNMCEGIVVRNMDSTFSAKIMSDRYDAEKK